MNDKYTTDDSIAAGDVLGSTQRYVVAVPDQDGVLRPVVEHKSNGKHVHLTYKTLSVAREAAFKVEDLQGLPAVVFDKQYGVAI